MELDREKLGLLKKEASNPNIQKAGSSRGLDTDPQKGIALIAPNGTRNRGGSSAEDETKFTKLVLDAIDDIAIEDELDVEDLLDDVDD